MKHTLIFTIVSFITLSCSDKPSDTGEKGDVFDNTEIVGLQNTPDWAKKDVENTKAILLESYKISQKFQDLTGKKFPIKIVNLVGQPIKLKKVNIIYASAFDGAGEATSGTNGWNILKSALSVDKNAQIIRLIFSGEKISNEIDSIDQIDDSKKYFPNSGKAETTLGISGGLAHVWILNSDGIVTGHLGPGTLYLLQEENFLNSVIAGDKISEIDKVYTEDGADFSQINSSEMKDAYSNGNGMIYISDSGCSICRVTPNFAKSMKSLMPSKTQIIYLVDEDTPNLDKDSINIKLSEKKMQDIFGKVYLKPRILIFSHGKIIGEVPFSLRELKIPNEKDKSIILYSSIEASLIDILRDIN